MGVPVPNRLCLEGLNPAGTRVSLSAIHLDRACSFSFPGLCVFQPCPLTTCNPASLWIRAQLDSLTSTKADVHRQPGPLGVIFCKKAELPRMRGGETPARPALEVSLPQPQTLLTGVGFCAVHCVKRARPHRWKCAQVTFWSADEQLCHLWLQTLRELLDSLSTWASFRICCQAAQLWWHSGLSDLTQVDVTDPFDLFSCFLLRGSQWSSRSV